MQPGLPRIDADPQRGVEARLQRSASHTLPCRPTAGRVSGHSRPRLAGGAWSLCLLHDALEDSGRPGSGTSRCSTTTSTSRAGEDRFARVVPQGSTAAFVARLSHRMRAGLDHASRRRVGPGLQDRLVRRFDAPLARAPLQLGTPGRRCAVGYRDAQQTLGATIRCAGCCGRTSTAPSRATTWSPAGSWHAVATSRPSSALLRRDVPVIRRHLSEYRHIVNDPETDGNSRGVRGAGFDTPTQENLEALFNVMHDSCATIWRSTTREVPPAPQRASDRQAWPGSRNSTGAFPTELA